MEAVECTHCGVVMTSWSAPGSPIRYYQCPFCARTHSSLYGEVFRRRAGARMLDGAPSAALPGTGGGIPMASPEDVRWREVKAVAARWFERLEADERRHGPVVARDGGRAPSAPPVGARAAASRIATARATTARPAPAGRVPAPAPDVPEADPGDVVEVRPAARRRKR